MNTLKLIADACRHRAHDIQANIDACGRADVPEPSDDAEFVLCDDTIGTPQQAKQLLMLAAMFDALEGMTT